MARGLYKGRAEDGAWEQSSQVMTHDFMRRVTEWSKEDTDTVLFTAPFFSSTGWQDTDE